MNQPVRKMLCVDCAKWKSSWMYRELCAFFFAPPPKTIQPVFTCNIRWTELEKTIKEGLAKAAGEPHWKGEEE